MEFKGPGIKMMHVAGFCNTWRAQENALAGCRGLFRSLCNQLIAQTPYKSGLKLTRLSNIFLKELKKPSLAIETMLKLFQDLIDDVAEMGVREKLPAQEVIVIIDGIDWLEDQGDNFAVSTSDAQTLVRDYKQVVHTNGSQSAVASAPWSNMTITERKVVEHWLNDEGQGQNSETKQSQGGTAVSSSKPLESWEKVVLYFRGLVDECVCTDLGKQVR